MQALYFILAAVHMVSLVVTGIAYMFPRTKGLDPFYYWTKGWPMVLSMIGLACLIVAVIWTAVVLVLYAVAGSGGT